MATLAVLPPSGITGAVSFDSTSDLDQGPIPDEYVFDPRQHIDFIPPSKVHTMLELSFPENAGVSPMAVSEPFHLFTPAAIRQMRAEILSNKVWDNCQYSSNLAQCQLRGFAAQ